MHTRIVSFTGGTKDIEGGLRLLREKAIPLLKEQEGYRGVSASVDRDNDVFSVLSLWDTAAQRDAVDTVLAPVRAEAAQTFGGEVEVETFEQFVAEVGPQPPGPGSWLMLTPIRMDPSAIDDNIAFFKSEVLPSIKATPGFRGLRNMIDRETGAGVVGTAWDDRPAMERAAAEAVARREVGQARGISFGEISFREILLAEMT